MSFSKSGRHYAAILLQIIFDLLMGWARNTARTRKSLHAVDTKGIPYDMFDSTGYNLCYDRMLAVWLHDMRLHDIVNLSSTVSLSMRGAWCRE